MIEVIAEHSVDMALLPDHAHIIDLGCRGFGFTDYMRGQGHTVLAVDIDDLGREDYARLAVTDKVGRVGIRRTNDPQATRICKGDEVICVDINTLCEGRFWDLIKMDIEGSEREVIMSMTSPVAKQLSIEFHLHTGVYEHYDVRAMETHLWNLGYEAVQHELTEAHGAGKNYWDSLFILK